MALLYGGLSLVTGNEEPRGHGGWRTAGWLDLRARALVIYIPMPSGWISRAEEIRQGLVSMSCPVGYIVWHIYRRVFNETIKIRPDWSY